MKNLPVWLRGLRGTNSLGLLIILAVGAVFLSAAFSKPTAQSSIQKRKLEQPNRGIQANRGIQVANRTQSIEVISAEINNGLVHVSLKNDSNKAVDGLQVRIGDVAVQTEFLGTDITFPAGSVHEETYPVQQDSGNRGIMILCVKFEDGSSEGEPKYIKQIENIRFGERTQTHRAGLLIDETLRRSNVNSEALDKLKNDISALPLRIDENDNDYVLIGLQDRRTELINQIEGVRRAQSLDGTSGPQELMTLKQQLNRRTKQ